MAEFSVGDTVKTTGSNMDVTIASIRSNKGHTWYVMTDGTTHHERYVWSGKHTIAYCSQLTCQRLIKFESEVEGVDYIKDEYGFDMCKKHETEQWNEEFVPFSKREE